MQVTHDAGHIMVVDGVFEPEFCEEIIKRFDADPLRAESWSTKNNQKQYREGKCLTISRQPHWKDVDDRMFARLTGALKLYADRYNIFTKLDDVGYTVAEQAPGEKTNQHIDSIHGASAFRLITIILYLNEPGSGGETVFPEQGFRAKPQVGRMVMFPPFYTHPHLSTPAEKKRYILVSWAHSDPKLYTPGDWI